MDDQLSKRLKNLGVHLGANHLKSTPKNEKKLPGFLNINNEFQNVFGNSIGVDTYYDHTYQHGEKTYFSPTLNDLEINFDSVSPIKYTDCLFIDTETTGLSQSAGTFAFMVGVGVFESNQFHLRQYFLRNPGEEQAMLLDLSNFVEPYQTLVSYNGIGFDIPILSNRYKLYRLPSPFKTKDHVDLLKYARKLWRFQYDNRSLKSIEANVLRFNRSDEEIPGWMVPDMYRDYLRTGNSAQMNGVFYHNAMDIVSLGVLIQLVDEVYLNPERFIEQFDTIHYALAVHHQKETNYDSAIDIYTEALKQTNLDAQIRLKCLENLAGLHKKQKKYEAAIPLWIEAIHLNSEKSFIELAKYYEHIENNYEEALQYVNQVLHLIEFNYPDHQKRIILPQIRHRKTRLEEKINTRKTNHERP